MEISKCLLCYRRKKKTKTKTKKKERKKLLGTVLQILEGPGSLLIFIMTCWLVLKTKDFHGEKWLLWEVFQNLSSELQGELLLSVRWSMSVAPAGIMYYPTMDSKLVKVVNTITFATYKTFFLWSWLTLCSIIPHCLNSFTVKCHWHEQNLTYKIQDLLNINYIY